MANLNITNTDTALVLVEIWERGSGGQADTQVGIQPLGGGETAAGLAVGSTRYLVVRAADAGDAKTIDNWSQTPPDDKG